MSTQILAGYTGPAKYLDFKDYMYVLVFINVNLFLFYPGLYFPELPKNYFLQIQVAIFYFKRPQRRPDNC